ncbi:magnesium transporter [Gordonia terrae]|uniref:Magnesium transporter MgtE n=2 Tax=Gordonia terrae TaxID=2055 RepID=A0AAD0KEB9_9ACTN|nr:MULTISPECIES: magnesium transporter [Gordonia]VTR10599.1 magnesium transporter [Clostridioides difficile]ANY24211.1 magnesium transporter [Gordonia terrae]AWO84957.1 magnesium transporter [Gordonia terrae]VTS57669.1 Magnesium transporter mgtE [Gordonia terrae]GAB42565.1 magnesium transporter [Gordonia terrae NBRC 100016]
MENTRTLDAGELDELISAGGLAEVGTTLSTLPAGDIAALLDRLPHKSRGIAFRLLAKDLAVEVFDDLSAGSQRRLIDDLGTAEVAAAFDHLDPDDRAELLDELPAGVAKSLIQQLTPAERDMTAVVLGYPRGSVGRRMSPEFVHAREDESAGDALARVRERGHAAETIYTVPVLDGARSLCGVVSLRDLLLADPADTVRDLMNKPMFAHAEDDAETTAQRCVDRGILAMPVVDNDSRLVGVLTIDDAVEVVEQARDTDEARAGAREPLRDPYLLSSILSITRARIVWLFVLAVSAILTVNVLEIFEGTLEQRVALALFIPLLTGIGGNTGSQAATTVTRALATDEVAPRDVARVAAKEVRVGLTMGALLGLAGFTVAALVYGLDIGVVIGLTILSVCTLAATVGGVMPLIAKSIRVDPAVFSTPFISTFCDATGLLVYFSIAKAVLGI